ncbi:MAG: cysteine--tRNA ligase [Elusimicrobiales bacterium]
MLLYNTLSRMKEEFSAPSGEARIYCCGPTVYNYAHIGNYRTYIFEDILVRALNAEGARTKHVMNVTDVGHLVSDADEGEDKMEKGARREGKTAWDIAAFYEKAFFDDFAKFGCRAPDIICKATAHIGEMTALVKTLEEKGFTYKTSDGIYYDTSKFPGYHRLAGKSHMDGIKSGARVEAGEKRSPTDFALWKFSPQGQTRQMEWDSPWGKGFPGWHIECSAMAMKYLGETLDIHCGGADHVAVHHTNEIAQAEAATGKPFSRFWLHGAFLSLKNAEKMAKSSGEFLTAAELEKRGYDPLAYRYLCLSAHYRKPLEFSWEALDFAAKSLSTLREKAAALPEQYKHEPLKARESLKTFMEAVSDDMNMPAALAVVWEAVRGGVPDYEKEHFLKEADKALGLNLFAKPPQAEIPPEAQSLIEKRDAARKAGNFSEADSLRRQLEQMGVTLKDTPQGSRAVFKKAA